MSIRTRVTLYGISVVALVLLVISTLFGVLLISSVPGSQDQELQERARYAVGRVEQAQTLELQSPLAAVDVMAGKDIVLLILDEQGTVLTTTGLVDGAAPQIPAELLRSARAQGEAVGTVTAGSGKLRVNVQPWQRAEDPRSGYVVSAQALGRRVADQVGVIVIIILSDLISMVAAIMAIWLATGRALRPLRQLSATADEVGRSADLTRRLPAVRQRDDLGRLTASFNAMMDRLQSAYAELAGALTAQRRFTADVSHELRTPLTTIRSNAGFLAAHPDADQAERVAATADIASESDRMARLIDDLLALARAEAGKGTRHPDLNLDELVQEVAGQARRTHPDRRFYPTVEQVSVAADPDDLRRLLWILIDNAAAYTEPGGQIWITLRNEEGRRVLTVSDDGCGIPQESRERVFDRFYRVDPQLRPSGTGLGLAIAQTIVLAHGGRIQVGGNGSGGASFVVTFPVGGTPTIALSSNS